MEPIVILVILSLASGIPAASTGGTTTFTTQTTGGTDTTEGGTITTGGTGTTDGTMTTGAVTTDGTMTTGTGTTGGTSGTTTGGTTTIGTTTFGAGVETTTAPIAAATTEFETSENTAKISNVKVKIGKTIFKCNFFLAFTGDIVNLSSTTMSCKGKSKKSGKVTLKTPEGFIFNGVVKPPRTIVKLAGGDLFGEEYKNISTETKRELSTHCGGYNGEIEGR